MAHIRIYVGFLALTWGCATAAAAQPIYRCGNSYSQQPCGDSAPLPLHDPRSPAQQAEARASALRADKEADRLESERLALERAAGQRSKQPAALASAADKPKKGNAKAPQNPPPFTATVHTPKPAGKGKSKSKDKKLPPADTAAPTAKS